MCGRYYTRRQKQQIAEYFRTGNIFEDPLAPHYNIAPSTFQPIVRQDRDDPSVRELVLARWGLLPFFAKSPADFKGFSTINARAETVATAATFRKPFQSRRCIVPADGFYEWKPLDDSATPKKQPFAFSLRDGSPLAFAGLWDAWRDPATETWLQSFTIITTEANELMSQVHTRMPVILHPRDWPRWLDRSLTGQPPLNLLRPFDSDAMQATACNPAVGNVRNNGPEMLVCPNPPEPPSLLNSA